jgi:surface protein
MKYHTAFLAITVALASVSSAWAGKSLSFDGSGDKVATGMTIDLDNALSISVWVKAVSVTTNNYAILGATTTSSDYWMLLPRTNTNGLTLQHRRNTDGGGSMSTTPSQNISANTWTHVVVAKSSGSTVKIYQNNLKITEESLSYTGYTPAQLFIGSPGDNANWLNGKIDEAAVWNLELSAAEVTALYNSGSGASALTIQSGGLQGYWKFDAISGPTATDSSGNNRHGTITNAVESADVPFGDFPPPNAPPTGGVGIVHQPVNPSGSIITVSSTIQAAIDLAQANDMVVVPAGSYFENITIPNSPVFSLVGAGPELSIIRGVPGAGVPVVKFLGGSSTMEGFTVTDGNTTGQWAGAGIDIRNGNPTLRNLMIRDNHGTNAGGGVYVEAGNPVLSNLVIVNNTATYRGGGIYVNTSSASLVASNLTISGNLAGEAGAGINNRYGEVRLRNSILWNNRHFGNNSLDEFYFFNPNYTSQTHYFKIGHSIISTGMPGGTGFVNEGNNLTADPLFENAAGLDFSLSSGSPALDAGSAAATADFGAITEFTGTAPDMGKQFLPTPAMQGDVLTAANNIADADGLGTIAYQWKRGGSPIGGATGSIYTLTQADVGTVITVTASYTDGGGNAENATSVATSTVDAAPDATPVITSYGGNATATVNAPENQTFAAAVNATDADGNVLVYSISGGADQAKFDLNATSGILTFKTAPDFEIPTDADTNNTYVVEVNASDGTAWDLQTVTVTVTDVPEVFIPADRTALLNAVNLWTSNNSLALSTFGAINTWDVSQITDMQEIFRNKTTFNDDISDWNVSNVTTMKWMFRDATSFNQDISTWDVSNVGSFMGTFEGSTAFNQNIGDWNVSNATNMGYMFYNATLSDANKGLIHASFSPNSNWTYDWREFVVIDDSNFQTAVNLWFSNQAEANATYGHIRDWNVSGVTDMSNAFQNRTTFNENISGWDVSNVTSMQSMFYGANSFNQPIGDWNVSSVTNMQYILRGASVFNQPIGDWNVSSATNMHCMFFGASSFSQPIGNWNTSAVNNMSYIFHGATGFNHPIGNWNTSDVQNMQCMFKNASTFNQNIGDWNTSSVNNMSQMFQGATSFNQPIGNWNVSAVTNMYRIFHYASSFNQPIGDWNVSNVLSMNDAFHAATAFNQDLSDWTLSTDLNMTSMFYNTPALSDTNKGLIHASFSTNQYWPYDWSAFVTSPPPNQTGDNNQTAPPPDNNGTSPPPEDNNTQTDQNATAPAPGDPPPTLFRPLPKTLPHEELANGNFRLWGMILADGGSPVTEVAFEVADNMVFRNSTLHTATMLAGSPNFFGELTLEPGKRHYYRAVATNAIGTTSGSPKRLTTPPSEARWWTNAPEISGGWRNSPWLGAFRPYDNGWIYHAKLGWAYAHPDGSGGLWLWFRDHHWMWTRSGVFPYLWKHDLGTWHYLLGTRNGQPVFYEWTGHAPLTQP